MSFRPSSRKLLTEERQNKGVKILVLPCMYAQSSLSPPQENYRLLLVHSRN